MIRFILRLFGLVLLLAVAAFFIFAPGIAETAQNRIIAHEPYAISPPAQDLHASLVIGDWHSDTLMWKRDPLKRADRGHVDVPRLVAGNVAVQMFTTVTKSPAGQNYDNNSAKARDQLTPLMIGQLWPIRTWFNLTERGLYMAKRLARAESEAPEALKIIRSKGDLEAVLAARSGGAALTGALLGAEGGHVLSGDLANLDRLYGAGFRMIGLTHFFDNALGGSLHGQNNQGLTEFGRAVVAGMVERGIIIDLAHTSPQMARDVIAMTDVPLVVSHTGIYGNCPAKRNFPDALMQDIVASGGLIAIGYWEDVTCDASPVGVARTIKAAIALLGADHVALGSDYDGAVEVSFDTSELAALTQALMEEGVGEADIRAVMGGNMIRFLQSALPG
ncbi:MAG: microsomal dipeptidase-like Zn-dependent dipeptidase [Halocynthiibacter sp.]|jgi:membrane dipeptidase